MKRQEIAVSTTISSSSTGWVVEGRREEPKRDANSQTGKLPSLLQYQALQLVGLWKGGAEEGWKQPNREGGMGDVGGDRLCYHWRAVYIKV